MAKRIGLLMVLAALVATACAPAAGSSEPPVVSTPPTSHGNEIGGYVDLVDALRRAGGVVEPGGSVSQPFFSAKGQVILVNGEKVQVFEYESPAAADAEADEVSRDGSSVGTTMVTWIASPHFYRAGKLIVLYVGEDVAVKALLNSVLGQAFASGERSGDVPGEPAAPDSNASRGISGAAAVDGIEILILESFPVQVRIVARGYLPDECTKIDRIATDRESNTFYVSVATTRPVDAMCTQALAPFEEKIPLDVVHLKAGTYTVNVNGVTDSFTFTTDNGPIEEPSH